jgi:fumarate reductase flavoprotein subunit
MTNRKFHTDVLVIGGGGTGLVAALSAAEKNAHVILLEKVSTYGGATAMSSGKIPAAGTDLQKKAGVEDNKEMLMRDIYRAGDYTQNRELLEVAVNNAKEIEEWLASVGVNWHLETDLIYYGQSTYRMHVSENDGAGLIQALVDKVNATENIIAFTDMPVAELLTEDGVVKGAVIAKDNERYEVYAEKVILATSGFGANREMVEEYVPSIVNAVEMVAPGATGEGIQWGKELGAGLKAMNAYQGYAPISSHTHNPIEQSFLNEGGILVNEKGYRFTNEYQGYSPLATSIVNQPNAYTYMIWNQEIQNRDFPSLQVIEEEEIIKASTVEELAEKLGLDFDTLENEIKFYQQGIESGEDLLNRTKLPDSFEGPYYAMKVTGDFRHTQGGLTINPQTAEVLKEKSKEVIPNLYAGGGVTEGFSSDGSADYMSGNGLLQAFVFGRIAGSHASESIDKHVDSETFKEQKDDLRQIAEGMKQLKKSDAIYKDGKYKATSTGKHGEITVVVEVQDGEIINVDISDNENEVISNTALKRVPQQIIETNSTDVDAVSGATATSKGIIDAVNLALENAK